MKASEKTEKKKETHDRNQSEKSERTAPTEWEDIRDGRPKPKEHN
jgi:hypothetical protein